MSNILNQLISKKISLEDALYRLLVISNEIGNIKLSEWCTHELKGYSNQHELPDYRKFSSANIYFTGIWGITKFQKAPIQPGYLSQKTMKEISKICLFEGISDVIKRKDLETPPYKELNWLAPEIYKNTSQIPGNYDGLQCVSIIQDIPMELYQRVYSDVHVRVINILSYLEKNGIDIDNCELEHQLSKFVN